MILFDKLCHKYTKRKVYLGTAILLILINTITMFIIYKTNTSFTIGDQKFRYVSDKRNTVLFKDNQDNEINVIIENGTKSSILDIIATKYQVIYKDKEIKADFSNWFYDGIIIQTNERDYKLTFSQYSDFSTNEYGPFDINLVYNLNTTYSFAKDKSFIWAMIFIIFPFIFLGLAGIMYPEELWRFNHMFTVRGGEPTEWAIFSNKLGGVIIIAIALLVPLMFL